MRKREILREVRKLINVVDAYNQKTKPHSEEDSWSGELNSNLCASYSQACKRTRREE